MYPSIFPCLFFLCKSPVTYWNLLLEKYSDIFQIKGLAPSHLIWREVFQNVAGSGRVPAVPWANTRSKQQPWTHWLVVNTLFLTNTKPSITICFKLFFSINKSWILNNFLLPNTNWRKLLWSVLAFWMEPSWRLQLQLHYTDILAIHCL